MAKQSKVIHLIQIAWGHTCCAVCSVYVKTKPIEASIVTRGWQDMSKGTFDPTKVTCKRCLKNENYKTAMDRLKYPLFFLEDRIV